ncbi:Ferredoxin-thioredoxin reductase catalytic chain, chloroplastic [Hordeum vulgare]|nr:Ferredoxin-thioredoxin reductase catalytic chain, chloroplastic [Hordeum vulgare]
MMSITSTAGTPLCPPPVSRTDGTEAAAGDGGAADSSEQKSVEIMRQFSEQYARRSSTFFCSDKSVTAVVIKKKKPIFCMGLLTTRMNLELLSAPAGITTTRPPRRPKASGTTRASCEKGVYEALELRDGGSDYLGKGISKACIHST